MRHQPENQYNVNKAKGQTESHWRGLMEAKSVLRFLEELDGLYADRSHTASEQEWETALSEAHDTFDLYLRIRHLLTTTETRIRGFNLLVKYLSGKGDKIGVHKIHDCGTEDPSKWHEAGSTRSALSTSRSQRRPLRRRVTIDASGNASGNKLLGFQAPRRRQPLRRTAGPIRMATSSSTPSRRHYHTNCAEHIVGEGELP